jgi:hypothetical protein
MIVNQSLLRDLTLTETNYVSYGSLMKPTANLTGTGPPRYRGYTRVLSTVAWLQSDPSLLCAMAPLHRTSHPVEHGCGHHLLQLLPYRPLPIERHA